MDWELAGELARRALSSLYPNSNLLFEPNGLTSPARTPFRPSLYPNSNLLFEPNGLTPPAQTPFRPSLPFVPRSSTSQSMIPSQNLFPHAWTRPTPSNGMGPSFHSGNFESRPSYGSNVNNFAAGSSTSNCIFPGLRFQQLPPSPTHPSHQSAHRRIPPLWFQQLPSSPTDPSHQSPHRRIPPLTSSQSQNQQPHRQLQCKQSSHLQGRHPKQMAAQLRQAQVPAQRQPEFLLSARSVQSSENRNPNLPPAFLQSDFLLPGPRAQILPQFQFESSVASSPVMTTSLQPTPSETGFRRRHPPLPSGPPVQFTNAIGTPESAVQVGIHWQMNSSVTKLCEQPQRYTPVPAPAFTTSGGSGVGFPSSISSLPNSLVAQGVISDHVPQKRENGAIGVEFQQEVLREGHECVKMEALCDERMYEGAVYLNVSQRIVSKEGLNSKSAQGPIVHVNCKTGSGGAAVVDSIEDDIQVGGVGKDNSMPFLMDNFDLSEINEEQEDLQSRRKRPRY